MLLHEQRAPVTVDELLITAGVLVLLIVAIWFLSRDKNIMDD